jgi:hypothetical protein
MPADQTRVLKRVTEILNLCDPGTYSAVISARNKTRNSAAIADFVTEAGLIIARTLAATPSEFRQAFVGAAHTPAYRAFLPEHHGQPVYVEIEKYAGGPWRDADKGDYRRIESWRENAHLQYDDVAHDQQGSTLAGYYDIWEKRIYFTGNACRLGLATFTRADFAAKIPETFENTWVRLGVGESAKAGDGGYTATIAGMYGAKGMNDLAEFRTGQRIFAEVSDPEPTSALHR